MSSCQEVVNFQRVRVSCSDCNLHELCLPRGLDQEEMHLLDSVAQHPRPLHAGDFVFQAGDAFTAIYAVRSGVVKQYQDTDGGEERIMGFYLPGELLGLDAIWEGKHRCSAIALDTSSVCAFPYKQLEDVCARISGFHQQMCRLMSREISSENQFLLMLKNKTAQERIAGFLLNLSRRYERLGYSGSEFKLPMSREEIGNYLGLKTETVSRLFSKMHRDEIVESNRRFMKIIDVKKLQASVGNEYCHGNAAQF